MVDSRIPGFHRLSPEDRRAGLRGAFELSDETRAFLAGEARPSFSELDVMSENVVAEASLPFSVALNFKVNGRDVGVPMAVEEPSIVAAASHAAKLVRAGGGFEGDADPGVMTAQVQLDDVPEPSRAKAIVEGRRQELIDLANASIPNMVARGGGCRDIEPRVLSESEGVFVVHFYVDVGEAMGANLVDTVAEAVAPSIQSWIGGRIGLRILSNLPLRRMVRVRARVPRGALGPELVDGIARASRFAELDPFRAVTHNKGVLNAIDAAAVALGQDWRSIEAGAHAYASFGRERYGPLATWSDEGDLIGRLQMPLAVARVGGSTRALPSIRAAFEVVGAKSAAELAVVMAASGLACNLAALRALASEGIQKGHMRLHSRKSENGAKHDHR